MLCHEGGSPQRLPGTSRDGLGAVGGQVMQFVVISGHLFRHLLAPWAPRWPPWELLWRPPGTFCITFVSIFAISAPGRSLWLARVSSRSFPWGANVDFIWLIPMFYEGVRLEPKVPKRHPPGLPGTCFCYLFGTFWSTLPPLSPPVATLRPHFDIPGTPLAFLLDFGCLADPINL